MVLKPQKLPDLKNSTEDNKTPVVKTGQQIIDQQNEG